MGLDTLDVVSITTIENIDNIIEFSPYTTDIILERITTTGTFGYEDLSNTETITTKGIIKYNPERSFLRKVGILTEDDLPIIGLFLHKDKFKKGDIVKQITKDIVDSQIVDNEREFEIIDILSMGDLRTGRKAYKLAPIRG